MKHRLLMLAAASAAGAAHGVETPALRDPMQPPPAARSVAMVPAAVASAAAASLPSARHLLVVDGRRYVIDAGRRRQVGDLLGGARIESIEDSAVVVRSGAGVQRLPLFAGVVKRAVSGPDASATPEPSRPAPAPAPRTERAARAGGQP